MSMYQKFKTNPDLERNGIVVDYGDFRVTLARAGGANKRFERVTEAKTKPYRRAIQTETMDETVAVNLLREIYAETIILNWETRVDGEGVVVTAENRDQGRWVSGIEPPQEGQPLLPFTVENVVETLIALPDIFTDIQAQAMKGTLYREEILQAEAGN